MVFQLSALAFAHEDESLANIIVKAMESIVQDSGSHVDIVPEYVSLLGNIRACQQQTAAFQWAPLFEDVEWKIEKAFKDADRDELDSKKHYPKRRKLDNAPFKNLSTLMARGLPFSIFQSLLMWL